MFYILQGKIYLSQFMYKSERQNEIKRKKICMCINTHRQSWPCVLMYFHICLDTCQSSDTPRVRNFGIFNSKEATTVYTDSQTQTFDSDR